MTNTLFQIFGLIAFGALWAFIKPAGLDAETVRRVFSNTVYYLFLPALVLSILWKAPLGLDSIRISISAASGILVSLLAAWLACRMCNSRRDITGAMMLAAAFPNATYIGLPLLESTFGPWSRSIVLQYDMFACFPLVLTVGFSIANHYGSTVHKQNPLRSMVNVVPLWAMGIAILLNTGKVPMPEWIGGLLRMMGGAVIPLMLMSVGLALRRGLTEWRKLPMVIPVAAIQLFLMPLVVWGIGYTLGLQGQVLHAVVIEGALPSMALGIVICDRYGLNTGIYAAALTLTTIICIITLPLWFAWVQ
jgi:hypothetical protein